MDEIAFTEKPPPRGRARFRPLHADHYRVFTPYRKELRARRG